MGELDVVVCPEVSKKPGKAEEDNTHAGGENLQPAARIQNAGYNRALQDKDRFSEDEDCTDNVGCLPSNGQVGEEDIDDDMLMIGNAGLEGSEDAETSITEDNTERDNKCVYKIKHNPGKHN